MRFIDIRLKHYEYNCTDVIRYIKTSQHKLSTFMDGLSKGYTNDSCQLLSNDNSGESTNSSTIISIKALQIQKIAISHVRPRTTEGNE